MKIVIIHYLSVSPDTPYSIQSKLFILKIISNIQRFEDINKCDTKETETDHFDCTSSVNLEIFSLGDRACGLWAATVQFTCNQ